MIRLLSHFVFIFSNVDITPVDTIPDCISYMKTDTGKLLSKYEYKGQYWYAFQPALKVVDNNSDKMTTITFYDSTCHVVAKWTKGGIAGLNNVSPDTVDKKSIIPLWAEKDSAVTKASAYSKTVLPDTIQKMAILKKAKWIQQSDCGWIMYYQFQLLPKPNNGSTICFETTYYTAQGTTQAKIPFGKVSWWHWSDKDSVIFKQTQFRPGYR